MKHFLKVVDIQNDFVDAALGTKEAVAMLPAACKRIKNFEGEIFVVKAACAGVTPQSHEAALTTMQMYQINII